MQVTLAEAVTLLEGGGVVAYAAEGVYGLGCDPWNSDAIDKVFHMKHRDHTKPLLIVVSQLKQVFPFCPLSREKLKEVFLPQTTKPQTFIVPAREEVLLKSVNNTIAIRLSQHPTIRALCDAFGGGVVSTSANIQGTPPCQTGQEVTHVFGKAFPFLEGKLTHPGEVSEIFDAITKKQIR